MFSVRLKTVLSRVSCRNCTHLAKVAEKDGVRSVTMVDEKTRNSMSMEMTQTLLRAVTTNVTDAKLRVIVISSGGKMFSSGHNLKELSNSEGRQVFPLFSELMMAIKDCPVPVITVVDGAAVAAGLQLVAQSDIVISSKTSTFSTPGANYGIFCHTPGVALARAVPRKTAAHMLFTGLPITAEEALQRGLVSKVVEQNELESEVDKTCAAIKAKSKVIVSLGKKFFYRQLEMDLTTAYTKGAKAMSVSLDFVDGIEGLRSFSEKRAPVWKHLTHI